MSARKVVDRWVSLHKCPAPSELKDETPANTAQSVLVPTLLRIDRREERHLVAGTE